MPSGSVVHHRDKPGRPQLPYQLNWSLALLWREPVVDSTWLSDLKRAAEPDGVRVLEHRLATGVSQLLVSTRPERAGTGRFLRELRR
jgi:hypothetical protein